MDTESRIRFLRKKQRIYGNAILAACILFVVSLIIAEASRREVYLVVASFLLFSVFIQWMKKNRSFFLTSIEMRELDRWERDKLGTYWHKYYFPQALLQGVVSVYFVMQACFHTGSVPFSQELPWWYLVVASIFLMSIQNINMYLHAKRVDYRTMAELESYSKERMLFTVIFAVVVSVMTFIGFMLVLCMC